MDQDEFKASALLEEAQPFSTPHNQPSLRQNSGINESIDKSIKRQPSRNVSIKPLEGKKYKDRKSITLISTQNLVLNQEPSKFKNIQKMIDAFLESLPVQICMLIVTLYALFGDDIRVFSSNKDTEIVFQVLTIISLISFFIELVLQCIAKPDYFLGFYFWLDLISTLTMILDISWVTESWFGGGNPSSSGRAIKNIGQASRAGRRASRVIRVIRLIRLIKLYKQANQQYELNQQQKRMEDILKQQEQQEQSEQNNNSNNEHINSRKQSIISPTKQIRQQNQNDRTPDEESKFVDFVQLEDQTVKRNTPKGKIVLPPIQQQYQNPQECSSENRQNEELNSPLQQQDKNKNNTNQPDQIVLAQVKESQVGQLLQERTMKWVIVIVMSTLLSIPIFTYESYKEQLQSYETGLYRLYQFKDNSEQFSFAITDFIDYHKSQTEKVILIYVDQGQDCCNYDSKNAEQYFKGDYSQVSDLRSDDTNIFLVTNQDGDVKAYCITDNRQDNSLNAGLSIIRTFFVCGLLGTSALMFSNDISELILDPIDRMIKKVDRIANNPLEAAQMEEQEELLLEVLQKSKNKKDLAKKQEEMKMETAILEKLIMKIGALLAVGFGEAGSEIIAANMRQSGEVNPMIPGKKIMAIFGFCDIRNFTDATEVLQQGVMVFVNQIAEIVHGTVNHYSGSANKNIGDAFLLVWKFNSDDYGIDEQDQTKLKVYINKKTQQLADLSVVAFLKIITQITISKKLEKYKNHPGLNERLQNYSVKMGFGLHMGWAIEGAIGSKFKIDASYLSPNVNMASRLEAATKQFGSSILISGVLKQYLTAKCQKQLRHIDTVTVKGSLEPVEIHTVDVSFKNLTTKITQRYDVYDSSQMSKRAKKRYRVLNRLKRDKLKDKINQGQYDVADEFNTDPELKAIRGIFTQEFYEVWQQGFNHYIKGNWAEAKKIFKQTLELLPDHQDGPSNTLIHVIEENGGKAPNAWNGFRELTEK